ncbi:TraH family protein [Agrobacterium sp. SUL3]|uniref:TraH family protein n=1 Tax=Agrobacterium sp. SUL3 TaxID=1701910 RepID=UPI000699710D|nr:TraH family protein [Agrobacterium sp. SUL3]KNY31141.1 conjugal transfer protein TraH [Agrobacterium sp. SUL3]
MDAALTDNCFDAALPPAIVEQFIASAGSDDPLAITIRQGGRLVLIPKQRTPDEALSTIKDYVGRAVVRVGVTQLPAGIGIADASDLQPDIFDRCENLRTGTALFAKVARIVTKWYGSPTNNQLLPQMLDDTIYAWKTGDFEGQNVFKAEDPGGPTFFGKGSGEHQQAVPASEPEHHEEENTAAEPMNASDAGIRIDLSRIGGQK